MSEFTYDAAVFCLIFGSIFVVFFLIGCIYCYCWKKKIDRRLSRLGISVSDLERENGRPEPVTVESADTLWCGWCRYWWGDGGSTAEKEVEVEDHEESNDVLCNLTSKQSSHDPTRSNSITSIRAQYIRESPRMSRGSLYSRTSISDRSVPISQGGRRMSYDPFTLTQDLQVLDTRRRSEAFADRRKSEQFAGGQRRRSSVAQPQLLPSNKANKSRKSFSVEQV